VQIEPRLVTVVDGNPAVMGRELRASSDRKGATAGWSRSSSQPRPSTMSRQARRASGRPRTFCPAGASGSSDASIDEDRSAREAVP
jgi:hypothetical protein